MSSKISIFWFRRDLRLEDNIGLFKALQSEYPVLLIFIFDKNILDQLPKDDARISFIFERLKKINHELKAKHNSSLSIYHNTPENIFKSLISKYQIQAVYTNQDYEPYALTRDNKIKTLLQKSNIQFNSFKDQVIFEKDEIVKKDGNPYIVYTPYKNRWKETFDSSKLKIHTTKQHLHNLVKNIDFPGITLQEMGFITSSIKVRDFDTSPDIIQNYEATRNFPSKENGTSRIGPHLRFGTVGIRTIIKKAIEQENEVFLSELIWREFFMQILWHYPHTKNTSFKPKYDRIEWRNNEQDFQNWTIGKTGYPLVDAGMRQLNKTGYMHNRVRMVVASFLCKHLLIDWRWGEAYFAEKLLDYDMSANVGNWQWAAGSGVDAAPYFRIFNPTTQITKFDKQLIYINTWVKDLNELSYPSPIIEHKTARERCLKTYKEALNQ
ncbi:cryptochrome/photolyase family protein [Aquimarina muelleri]|uniref:Deoxyribodipyrimidine photo-lyase n=1 Tax=Aquimarina muelleri TaxID=279356 RepID=A0A918JX65_9FLAO|nr:deoxyribodipyrimidine photo-lyase [Aquimarina muelleri]MCX2761753.1 DNA photolyase family protein [Aquimarina muelleri]GGX15929.1 deoxyribodipyrimidine photo-lyase [Aquimarina muelleri]